MKKKNGFISMSIIYAFLVLFLMILLGILGFYSYNRVLLNKSHDNIKQTLTVKIEKNHPSG